MLLNTLKTVILKVKKKKKAQQCNDQARNNSNITFL